MSIRDRIKYRGRPELQDQITPKVQVQDDIVAPSGEWVPAPWLPVAWVRNDHQRGERAVVISAGKVVSLERSPYGAGGRRPRLVPSGLRLAFEAAPSAPVLSYTQADVEWETEDLVTGLPVAAPVTYNAQEVAAGIVARGLVSPQVIEDRGIDLPPNTAGRIEDIIEAFISMPVGYVPYDIFSYAGFAEEGDQKFTNDREQAAVTFWTEGQLRLPQLTAEVVDEGFDFDSIAPLSALTDGGLAVGSVYDATALALATRYAHVLSGTEPILGFVLEGVDVQVVTDRTPISSSSHPAVLSRQVSGPTKIANDGDWAVDYAAGILFVHEDAIAPLIAGDQELEVTYWAAGGSASAHPKYALFAGECQPGDYLGVDVHSNFVSLGDQPDGLIIGRVDDFEVWPKHLQQYRKTAWDINATGFGATTRMPGSATKGFPDAFTLPEIQGHKIADRFVIVHVRFN